MIELKARDLKVGDEFTVNDGETWNEVEEILHLRGPVLYFVVRATTFNEHGAPSVLSTKKVLFMLPSRLVIVR